MKTIETLLEDIAHVLENNHVPSEENLRKLSEHIVASVKDKLKREGSGKFSLRFSNIGYPDRYLWYSSRAPEVSGNLDYSTVLKFLIGDIYEAVVIFLIKEAGHKVTDEQKKITIDGLTGSMDAKVDGVPIDIKSASGYSFKTKFSNGNLANDDHWGYVAQLSGYAQGDPDYDPEAGVAILGANKETGELALYHLDPLEMTNAKHRIGKARTVINAAEKPERCYREADEGKSGNRTIAKACTWCPFKFDCWSDANKGKGLRVFQYSNGLKYFTHIEKEPNVPELVKGKSDETVLVD